MAPLSVQIVGKNLLVVLGLKAIFGHSGDERFFMADPVADMKD